MAIIRFMNSFERMEPTPKKESELPLVESLEEKPGTDVESAVEGQESKEQQETMEAMEEGRERRGELAKNIFTSEIVSNGLDVLPFAGSGKMIVE